MQQRLYNEKSRQFLDLIQLKLDCCGAETMLDYAKMQQDIPASCNHPRTNNINIRVSVLLWSIEKLASNNLAIELCWDASSIFGEARWRHRWSVLLTDIGEAGHILLHHPSLHGDKEGKPRLQQSKLSTLTLNWLGTRQSNNNVDNNNKYTKFTV